MPLSSLDRRGPLTDNRSVDRLCRFQLRHLGATVCRPLFMVCIALWLSTLVGCGNGTPPPANSAPKDFSISVSPATITANADTSSAAFTVSTTAQNGFSDPVTITISGLPAGATTSPAVPLGVPVSKSQTVTLSLSASTGSFPLTVTGTSGSSTHSAPLTLTINASYTAASCSSADVLTALNSITTDGTLVNIPTGNCTWTTPTTYTQTNSFTLACAGAQSSPSGGGTSPVGTDQTIIEDNINHAGADPAMLEITTILGKSFRLTGCAFYYAAGNATTTFNGSVAITGLSQAIRVDHNHFNFINDQSLTLSGCEYGVIDHNFFDHRKTQVTVRHPNCNGETDGWGDQTWAAPSNWGSSQFIFIEDNTFNGNATVQGGGAANDCDHGGRLVFRYNTLNSANFQVHEMEGRGQGCRAYEVYSNTVNTPNVENSFAYLRTGTGLLWGNTTTGVKVFVSAHNDRSETINAGFPPPPTSWGKCGTTLGPSAWDGNTDSTGYPCFNQLGRGQGDLLANAFPIAVDSVTGTITFPNEALEPIYVWNNTYSPPRGNPYLLWNTYAQEIGSIQENRDYYLQLPNGNEPQSFDGTAGVGSGLFSARPAACTPLVGYWATDTQKLYLCTTLNTWTTFYTPYTYPHPLQGVLQ
jgi:hypothetical protein